MSTSAAGIATSAGGGTSAAPLDTPAALELPDDVEFKLDQFKHLLAELQKALQATATQVSGPADLAAILDPLERARLCMCVAKAVNSLHHVYLR
jgi:exosome complex protein LRP1